MFLCLMTVVLLSKWTHLEEAASAIQADPNCVTRGLTTLFAYSVCLFVCLFVFLSGW